MTRVLLFVALLLAVPAGAQERFSFFHASTPESVERMLTMAGLRDDDVVVDLGSGNGLIPLTAARMNPKLRGWGVDIDPKLVDESNQRAKAEGLADRVRFLHQNAFDVDLREATVVTMWLFPELMYLLRPIILERAKPGTRVLTSTWNLGSWQPDEASTEEGPPIYKWIVPARVAGAWQWELELAGKRVTYSSVKEQQFQKVEGVARAGDRREVLEQVTLRGEDIGFTLNITIDGLGLTSHEFRGKVQGDQIVGTVAINPTDGAATTLPWRARRVAVSNYFAPTGTAMPAGRLFEPDRVHTNQAGADFNAAAFVAGLKALQNVSMTALLSTRGAAVAAAPPARVMEPSRQARSLPEPANPALPALFLIGDSTVRNGQGDGTGGQWGWGEPLVDHFNPARINVVNRAVGGLSSRTYLTLGHWDRVLAMLKPGDFVLMQFGHNDAGALNDEPPGPLRARGTIPGIGEETKAIDNVMTKQYEVVHTYGWYLRRFVADARAKGATPIICSLIPRKMWMSDGTIRRNRTDYAGWAAAVATAERTGFVDLNELVARRYDELGRDAVMALFPREPADERTHTNRAGAELNASLVVVGLKDLKGNPFGAYFSRLEPFGKD